MEKLKGVDLKTDLAIQEICKNSNATSSSSRSVLYVIMLTSIISLIAILNSYMWNWGTEKKNFFLTVQTAYDRKYNAEKSDTTKQKIDRIREDIDRQLNSYTRHLSENNESVRIPILGSSFDVNDLGIITGISLFILLIILRFTLSREINNLIIAFNSITDRYPLDANRGDFEDYLNTIKSDEKDEVLANINYTRRLHHYNYLSMNEIFSLPPLETSENEFRGSIIGRLLSKMYWFPCIVYFLIVLNDTTTIGYGLNMSYYHTIISYSFNILSLIAIAILCHKCTKSKAMIDKIYTDFKENNYQYFKFVTVPYTNTL